MRAVPVIQPDRTNWYENFPLPPGARSRLFRRLRPALSIPPASGMNYYPHHIGDYAAATRGLSLLEHGAYRSMLDLYYLDEKPLPAELSRLCRLLAARNKEERAAVSFIAGRYFKVSGKRLRHKRCDEEIATYKSMVARNRVNGIKGGRPHKPGARTRGRLPKGAAAKVPRGASAAANEQCPRLTFLPKGFGLSEPVRRWATERGYDRLEQRLEHFIRYARRRAACYADWDEALMSAISQDWAGFNAATHSIGTGNNAAPVSYLREGEVM